MELARRRRASKSIESAGRWWLIRPPRADSDGSLETHSTAQAREKAVEAFGRALLRRYGVVFRRLLERETLNATWYELGRFYRRLEARGEIRGGYFIAGVSGEQFAPPQAVEMMRSVRKSAPDGELIVLSGADPLNLAGILTPGPRIAALRTNRILFRDGAPIAALQAGEIVPLTSQPQMAASTIERTLTVGALPPALRPYYG
jgi:ATP-dependent Lhr-like helicase